MKKTIMFLTVAAGLLLAVSTSRLLAADAASKEVTITGKMVCGKCTLHETTECQKSSRSSRPARPSIIT